MESLRTPEHLLGLIGKPEDADFDCKVWPEGAGAARGMIAKAACGFANATGGVIVIGMKASGGRNQEPDVVTQEMPVADMGAVASAALDIIQQQIEPGIEGVQIELVAREEGSKSGFVLIFVPSTEGSPHRSRVDWKFYVRVASGTLPMEYFQIEDRFGKRPHAVLRLSFSEPQTRNVVMNPDAAERLIRIAVANEGRAVARYPALRVAQESTFHESSSPYSSDQSVWAFINTNNGWWSYRGRANDVLYPGEELTIATLVQSGRAAGRLPQSIQPRSAIATYFDFAATSITAEVVCDGVAPLQKTLIVPALLHSASLS